MNEKENSFLFIILCKENGSKRSILKIYFYCFSWRHSIGLNPPHCLAGNILIITVYNFDLVGTKRFSS